MENLVGRKFNRLLVLKFSHLKNRQHSFWEVICDCGTKKIVSASNLKRENTKSCGCLQEENRTTHRDSKTNIYMVWHSMKARCLNKNNPGYKNYGGRGISVCNKWLKYEGFKEDMFLTYRQGLCIDRINNDGNYCKANCRWATYKEQNNNTRHVRKFLWMGTIFTIMELSEFYHIKYDKLHYRLSKNWPIEIALK